MKIALMIPEMDMGGVEQGVYDLAVGLREAGHDSMVISGNGSYVPRLLQRGVLWFNVPTARKTPAVLAAASLRLAGILADERPDILHCRSRFPAWIAAAVLRFFPRTHFVTGIHGFYRNRLYSGILGRGQRVIAISEELAGYARDFLRARPYRVRVVPNGVDPGPFLSLRRRAHAEYVVGAIGRFTEVKGYRFLLEAVSRLGSSIPRLRLVLVGGGPCEASLAALAARLGLTNVSFRRGRSADVLPDMDLLVAPHAMTEPISRGSRIWIGRAAVEAQLAGIPVITTATGIPAGSRVRTETAWFVPPRDPGALAEAIRHVHFHREESEGCVFRARQYALEHFSIRAMVRKTLNVYGEIAC